MHQFNHEFILKMGSTTPITSLPYWQSNIPPLQRTTTCPPFLLNLSEKDISILSTPNNSYVPLSWPVVKDIISRNDLGAFQRWPSDLRRYLEYIHNVKKQYGSILSFILKERLGWDENEIKDGKVKGGFENDKNSKILYNDWPYGIDERIVHLVVWTKFELKDDVETGDLSMESRDMIEEYVGKRFVEVMGEENVIWFKNWSSLKSIRAVEHFHVMLFDPNLDFVKDITNGDVPLCQQIGKE